MKEIEINYTTEDPAKEYAAAIRRAKSRAALVKAILPYKRVADDALEAARKMTDADFADFQKDILKAGKEQSRTWTEGFVARFGAIAMPIKLAMSMIVASEFHTPWGCAVIRCEEEGWKILNKLP